MVRHGCLAVVSHRLSLLEVRFPHGGLWGVLGVGSATGRRPGPTSEVGSGAGQSAGPSVRGIGVEDPDLASPTAVSAPRVDAVHQVLDDEGAPAGHLRHALDLVAAVEDRGLPTAGRCRRSSRRPGARFRPCRRRRVRRHSRRRPEAITPNSAPYIAPVIMWIIAPRMAEPNRKVKASSVHLPRAFMDFIMSESFVTPEGGDVVGAG